MLRASISYLDKSTTVRTELLFSTLALCRSVNLPLGLNAAGRKIESSKLRTNEIVSTLIGKRRGTDARELDEPVGTKRVALELT